LPRPALAGVSVGVRRTRGLTRRRAAGWTWSRPTVTVAGRPITF